MKRRSKEARELASPVFRRRIIRGKRKEKMYDEDGKNIQSYGSDKADRGYAFLKKNMKKEKEYGAAPARPTDKEILGDKREPKVTGDDW